MELADILLATHAFQLRLQQSERWLMAIGSECYVQVRHSSLCPTMHRLGAWKDKWISKGTCESVTSLNLKGLVLEFLENKRT